MEIGNFLGKLQGKEKEEPKKFLALVLTDEVVQAAVWHVQNGKTEIIAIGTPVDWDGETATTTELVTAVDATISNALEGITPEPSEVILGIPHSWSDKDGLLGVKKEFIKQVSNELELKPLGLVEITDSIISYLKMQEGTPTTSILIQVSRDELLLAHVKLGRTQGVVTIGRGDDIVQDVVEGIARFKIADNLPSRIILFNNMHSLDEITQNLTGFDWQSQFNFLHLPKIEALPKDIVIRALTVAGGSEVAKSLGFEISKSEPEKVTAEIEEKPDVVASPALLTAAEIGFSEPEPLKDEPPKTAFIDPEDTPPDLPPPPAKVKPRLTIPKIKLPKLKLPHLSLNLSIIRSRWSVIGAALLGLLLFIIWFVYLLPSAVINVRVIPKTLDQDVEITLSTEAVGIDHAQKIIPASVEQIEGSGEKIIETTGKKTIGDPATGEVTLYNRTTATKTFLKGTTLSASSLKFTLDQDVTVASKSAGSDYVDVPGKATVKITASAIGDKSNLSAGTEFSVQNFGTDSYVGKNDSALTGGDSEEVQVVSSEDQKTLTKDLTDEILTKLKESVSGAGSPGIGAYIIPSTSKVTKESYSAKIGETAKNLSGSLTVSTTLLKYKTDDVTTLVNQALDESVPEGYIRADLPTTVELIAENVNEEGTIVEGTAKLKVSLLPVVDMDSLQAALKGKNPSGIEVILASYIAGYQDTLVEITPRWLPPRFKSLPRNSARLTVNINPVSP